jgi:hypothetical protein
MKLLEIFPIFVEIPPDRDKMEEGKIYISEERKSSTHLCACGCGEETYLPFPYVAVDNSNRGWNHSINGDNITITPSIGNWSGQSPYHAHYYITNNKIVWC